MRQGQARQTHINHPTLDQLRTLKPNGIAEAFAKLQSQDGAASLSHAEWLGLRNDREVASRVTKRYLTRMRVARLRVATAVPEDVDYKARRGLDKALFQQLQSNRWIKDKRNVILAGPCGTGKTWLACALAHAACHSNITVLYKRVPRLFGAMELAHGDGTSHACSKV